MQVQSRLLPFDRDNTLQQYEYHRLKIQIDENEEISEDGILAEPVVRENIDFDKEEKVTSVALDEFLDGDINWDKTEESIEH